MQTLSFQGVPSHQTAKVFRKQKWLMVRYCGFLSVKADLLSDNQPILMSEM